MNALPDSAFQNKKVINKISKGKELRSENFNSKMHLHNCQNEVKSITGKALLEFNGIP